MNSTKRALLIGAGIATFGVGALGMTATTSAISVASNNPHQGVIDKLASTFNLNKTDVQAVFDEVHANHEKQMKSERNTALASALKDGKISQSQSNHIRGVWKQLDKLHDSKKNTANKKKMHNLMVELRTWMDEQGIDAPLLGVPPKDAGMRHGDVGHP